MLHQNLLYTSISFTLCFSISFYNCSNFRDIFINLASNLEEYIYQHMLNVIFSEFSNFLDYIEYGKFD